MLDQGTPTIFASLLEDIDAVAKTCFNGYQRVLGTHDEEYLEALEHYCYELGWVPLCKYKRVRLVQSFLLLKQEKIKGSV
jgi:hypothetical protein